MNTDSLEAHWFEPRSSTTMKGWSLVLAALAFTLLLLSSSEAKAEVNSLPLRVRSSSHQALKDLRGHGKDLAKQVESCFRAIPPSNSNPTQNKINKRRASFHRVRCRCFIIDPSTPTCPSTQSFHFFQLHLQTNQHHNITIQPKKKIAIAIPNPLS
ncbi:unnamed protein product [Sphenostylis stenocarpa]|uniref:Uncharacterized protein n=1 Tax=Sphenostylis stenocarpa TaxID=92480 RepID=A0AA86SBD8_9FABA|nr:unnamed protein product [Sphenostylis stenocarpa]